MAASLLAPEDIPLPPSPPELADPIAGHHSLPSLPTKEKMQQGASFFSSTLAIPPTPPQRVPSPGHTTFHRPHIRSRSLAGPPGAPLMARAHSSPGLDSRGRYVLPGSPARPSSPHGNTVRRHSPLRLAVDENPYPNLSSLHISEPISEHPELQSTPQSHSTYNRFDMAATSPIIPTPSPIALPRAARRRPSSPLHSGPIGGLGAPVSSSPTSMHSSPLTIPTKFNEPYPSYSFSSASSMPSTPTSIRSRSPSISSLETIPDIPDAEAAAIEADRIAKLKAAADRADAAAANNADSNRRRSAIDMSSSPLGNPRFGILGYGGGRMDKRKRWSVCGAEGRQDLDLETIWED
ncbi:hypothetical protein AJ80_08786 [Polytolypa hystricis UAMH7299]|uniref:Basic proline-rich protein n=1 Tax=Polytolypa hystricis (strain UAMH7299) TaxID=1447883 RepID=A0A2B7X2H1_POLH7|nr:hypothetical protein AJ80_08786 [Polytolypa hystricis UAMH7299]